MHHPLIIQQMKSPVEKGHVTPTLPETNIAPENKPLEKKNPIGNHHF